jgi:D-hydroxyproline dehydrogenase subunit gamma
VGDDLRIRGLERGRPVRFQLDGEPLLAHEGESLAAALWAAGRRVLRHTAREGSPRGLYCGMGVCFECVLEVDGRVVRACLEPVREGASVATRFR